MNKTAYFLPAEWAKQSFIQLTWPHENTDWAPYLDEITATMVEISEAVTRHERLVIASQTPAETCAALEAKLTTEQMEKVTIVECNTNDTWARDHGGISITPFLGCESTVLAASKHSSCSLKTQVLDFRFNGWGEKFDSQEDNKITSRLHEAGILEGELIDNDDFVLEGGSIESDGKGVIFTTSQCLMAPHRNQPMMQDEVEKQLLKRLHAKRIVWLNHGNLIGDDTDGHIDTIVRVCPDDTLLYVQSTDSADEQHADFTALEEELKALRTDEGKPYRLMPLPMPRACMFDDERLPATYANFLIINGAVIVPVYGQPDLDKVACDTIAEAFPGREIIAIDSNIIIRQHGSIHCLTMQYPEA